MYTLRLMYCLLSNSSCKGELGAILNLLATAITLVWQSHVYFIGLQKWMDHLEL